MSCPTFILTRTAPNQTSKPTGPSVASVSRHVSRITRAKPVLFESWISTLSISSTVIIFASNGSADAVELNILLLERSITHKFISLLSTRHMLGCGWFIHNSSIYSFSANFLARIVPQIQRSSTWNDWVSNYITNVNMSRILTNKAILWHLRSVNRLHTFKQT